jgi:hypothetical protein
MMATPFLFLSMGIAEMPSWNVAREHNTRALK